MSIEIIEEPVSALHTYGSVSPAFSVKARFVVEPIDHGLGGLALKVEPVDPPFVKDYDRGNALAPARWLEGWDLDHWGVLSAFDRSTRVGGALVAWDTPGIKMLDGRKDLAALWDIRVDREYRRQGVGAALFAASTGWARKRGCAAMKIETQNINVAACHFYARQGCRLVAIDPFAYPDLPHEIQFIWSIDL